MVGIAGTALVRGLQLRVPTVVVLALAVVLLALGAPSASAKNLGEWTDADVNAGITNGVVALDNVANKSNPALIHWDGAAQSGDVTDTAFALAAIGAAFKAEPSNVNPGVLADAKSAVQWLISMQDTSGTTTNGSWGVVSGSSGSNYATSIALMALGFFPDEPNAAQAIALGRSFEIMWQNAPPATTGNAASICTPPAGSFYGNCGSWTYDPTNACCGDGSNTGFAVTGLDFSGGIPPATAQANLAWARASQEIAGNPFATQQDGGGSYEPGETFESFRSSANGTGTILFSFAYDGVDVNEPAAQAAIVAATDVLDAYEASKAATPREAIYHLGVPRDPGCQVGSTGCNWLVSGDGGYHYSMFALSKGLGSFIVANVTDPANFYAKVADLLLGQQGPDGSWPADLRDDGSPVGATAFSVLALTKAGQLLGVTPSPGESPATPAETTTPSATPTTAPTPPPTAPACDDTRRFTFALHHARGQRVVKVQVFVNGKKTKTVKGRDLASVSISQLPQDTFTVKIVATQSSGSALTSRRVYRGCNKGKPRTRARHHRRARHKKT